MNEEKVDPDLLKEENIRQFIGLLSQLENSIQAFENLQMSVKICESINGTIQKIGKFNISDHKEPPFGNTNIVILACKCGRVEFLNYILSEDEDILVNLTKRIGRCPIQPKDRDLEGKTAFYYAAKHPETDLLKVLIDKWPKKQLTPDTLDENLSRASRELRLRNVPISTEMEVYVESVLADIRFYESAKPNQGKKKRVFNPNPVLQRIDFVLEKIEFALVHLPSHDSFMFSLRQIATSVHVLKRQLRPTYDSIPWEEIDFYLSSFIGCEGELKEMSLFHGSTLALQKVRRLLENLSHCLRHVKDNATTVLTGKFSFPKMTRAEMKENVLRSTPFESDFYDDFEALRDYVTLETVSRYLRLSTLVDPNEWQGRMILTRFLQVAGEHLKDTIESPKLSPVSAQVLLASLPPHTAEALQNLRHALSHDHALALRVELERNTVAFFERVQRDLRKLADTVESVKYRKKTSHTRKLLESIVCCDSIEDMRNLVGVDDFTLIEDIFQEGEQNPLVERLRTLLHCLRSRLKVITKYENSLLTDIDLFLNSENEQLKDIRQTFLKGHAWLNLIAIILRENEDKPQEMRNWAVEALRQLSPETQLPNFAKVKQGFLDLLSSIHPRLDSEEHEVLLIMLELSHVLDFDLGTVRWIHEFRNRLDDEDGGHKKRGKKGKSGDLYGDLLLEKTEMLKGVLEQNRLETRTMHESLAQYRKDEKLKALVEMLLLDIMSIFQADQRLSENPYFLDHDHPLLLGQNLRKHLAHENALVRVITDVDMDVLLAANTVVYTQDSVRQMDKVFANDPSALKDRDPNQVVLGQNRLFRAMEVGDISFVGDCLAGGADMRGRDSKGRTALHYASTVECVRLAVQSGVGSESVDKFGHCALHSAAMNGREAVVRFVIDELGATVDCRENFHCTPLHLAAGAGHSSVVKTLLERGATMHAEDGSGDRPLHSALGHGHPRTAMLLQERGEVHADSGETVAGFTPLHIAAERGLVEMVCHLLDLGAEVNLRNNEGFTALHRAALTGCDEAVKVLLSRGAEIAVFSLSGFTPAHLAAKNGHGSVLRLLKGKGIGLDTVDRTDGRTPLHLAAVGGHFEAVEELLNSGGKVEMKTVLGQTPLHLACFSGSQEVVELLLESGSDANAADNEGSTPLLIAAYQNDVGMVKLLLERGSDPNAMHKNQRYSALHFACTFGYAEIVRLLVEHGANLEIENGNSHTPLDLSIFFRHSEIAAFLIPRLRDVNRINGREYKLLSLAAMNGLKGVLEDLVSRGADLEPEVLCLACSSGNTEAVKFLIERGVDVNSTVSGTTPLHEAVQSNQFKTVKLLLELKALPDKKNNNGITPLGDAVKLNFKDIAEKLVEFKAEVSPEILTIAVDHGGELMKVLLKDRPFNMEEETILLHESCLAGIKSSAEVLWLRGASVSSVNYRGVPLFYSVVAAQHQYEILVFLMSKGVEINEGPEGMSPLFLASVTGQERTVDVLLNEGARIDETLAEKVVANGQLGVLKLLENKGAIGTKEVRNSLLRLAVDWGHLEIVRHLARKEIELGVVHNAALNGHLDVLNFFLEGGYSKIDEITECGETILHFAAYGQRENLAECLIVRGANVDATDVFGSTPAHVAASNGDVRFLEVLLEGGAAYDPLNCRSMTPSQVAGAYGFTKVVSFLSDTAELFEVVKKKDSKRTKAMLEKGAVANSKGRDGTTPLHLAAWKGCRHIAEVLLKNGANPDAKGKGGSTPLHYAAKHGHLGVVLVLLRGGARFDPRLASGKTPSDLASRPSQVAELLEFVHACFAAVQSGDCGVLAELEGKPSVWIKAALQARDRDHRTMMIVAIRCDFPRVSSLKAVLRDERRVAMMNAGGTSGISKTQLLIAARSEAFGADCPSVLDTMEDMAVEKHKMGLEEEALSDLKDVLRKRKERVGMGVEILVTQKNIACLLFAQGKHSECAEVYLELHRRQVQVYGPADCEAFRTLLNMAINTLAMGKYEEAMRQCDDLIMGLKNTEDGPQEMTDADDGTNQTPKDTKDGKYQTLKDTKDGINQAIKDTKQGANQTGTKEVTSQPLKDAKDGINQALKDSKDIKKVRNDVKDGIRLQALSVKASALQKTKKYDQAIRIFREICETRKKILGNAHPRTIDTLHDIKSVLTEQGKHLESLEICMEILHYQSSSSTTYTHLDVLKTATYIGKTFMARGQHLEAYKALSNVLSTSSKLGIPPPSDDVQKTLDLLEMRYEFVFTKGIQGVLEEPSEGLFEEVGYEELRQMSSAELRRLNSTDGSTLHCYVKSGDEASVRLLLRRGVDPLLKDQGGEDPLQLAVRLGRDSMVEILHNHLRLSRPWELQSRAELSEQKDEEGFNVL